ncbi:ABC transporter permease [Halobacillus yeomjeoni]|uniref:FtsX-like permease family protein n=1 Tax=Halobacillus yeomjeoni TaxID=311194 RepID=A0A931HU58_9BACI|nr:ABC transporter permease [Halobacillus yeomjeoni]MBH0229790.1 FtsX-like permease family protein [Halobacillus yeomjeoni]
MILRKSIIRTFKEKKFQYIGVVFLLVLAVTLYTSLSMAISTLDQRNRTFKNDYKQETFHFMTREPLKNSQLQELESEYDVILEERSFQDLDIGQDTVLRLFNTSEEVNVPFVSQGVMPQGKNEIALAKVFAEQHGYEIGDSITLAGTKAEVTGYVYLPDYIYMIQQQSDLLSNPDQFGFGITSKETLVNIQGEEQIQVIGWSETNSVPEGMRASVNEKSTLLQFVGHEDNARIQFVENEIEGAQTTITTLPLFVLALSIAMVLLLMKRRLDLQRKEIGTLMAIGYRKNELIRHYLGYAWFVGLSGTVLGTLAGIGLSIPLSNLYAQFFNLPSLSLFDWDPMVLVLGVATPLGLLLVLTFIVIWRALKVDPLTLLRPKEMTTGKKSWLEKLPVLNSGNFIKRFRLRLMVRSKWRSFYIFLGVMFSTVLLFFGLIMFNSMDRLVETTYEEIYTYDYAIHYKTLMTDTDETKDSKSPYTSSEVEVTTENDTNKALIYGIEPGTEYLNLSSEGEKLNDRLSEGAVLSKPLAAILGVSEEDEITLTNALNDEKRTIEVAGIADVFIGTSIYLPRSEVNQFLGFPGNAYTSIWQDQKPKMSENIFMIEDKQKVIESFESNSGATKSSVIGMAVFAVIIGVIVLTLLTNLIVEENSPSISLFKVMGYHDKEVSKLVLSVYTPVVMLSFFASIPLAVLSLEGTMNSLVKETGFLMPTEVSWWMVLIGFSIITFTYALSLTLSKQKLKKVSLQEALKKQQD